MLFLLNTFVFKTDLDRERLIGLSVIKVLLK